jgi:KDO2-lipid IV(A) lauroyltransferase
MPQTPSFRHRLEYLLFRSVEPAIRLLPWKAALGLGRGLGRLTCLVDARHRRVVRQNLRLTDLSLTDAQCRNLAKECFAHFGAMLMATIHLFHMNAEQLERLVHFDGLENWDAARSQGKGFIILTGHYGCWEAVGLVLSAMGRPFAAIGRTLDNPLLDPYLTTLRSRWGSSVIPKAGAMRDALRVLKQGGGVAFLLDQDALSTGVFTKFLGRWASTHSTAAMLAVKYQLPVVPIFSWPNDDGTISIRIDPPLTMSQSDDRERDIWTATQTMTRCIEDQIRKDPRWWFWMHRRFKTGPEGGTPLSAPLPPSEWIRSVPLTVNRG